jgi:hypothetical protein
MYLNAPKNYSYYIRNFSLHIKYILWYLLFSSCALNSMKLVSQI